MKPKKKSYRVWLRANAVVSSAYFVRANNPQDAALEALQQDLWWDVEEIISQPYVTEVKFLRRGKATP